MTRPATHPGEILSDEIHALGITATELARQLRVPANRITQIVEGRRSITGEIVSGMFRNAFFKAIMPGFDSAARRRAQSHQHG